MDPFVVSINAAGRAAHRRFWGGRRATAVLIVPGLVVAILGIGLGVASGRSGPEIFFAAVIVFFGLYAAYAGWDQRRRALRVTEEPPLAFALEPGGVVFPRNKRYAWPEVRFVLTAENPPRILCTPGGVAYAVEDLDRSPAAIDAALERMSSGQIRLERI